MLDRHGHRIASLRGIEQPRAELVGRGVEVAPWRDVAEESGTHGWLTRLQHSGAARDVLTTGDEF